MASVTILDDNYLN